MKELDQAGCRHAYVVLSLLKKLPDFAIDTVYVTLLYQNWNRFISLTLSVY